MTQRVPGDPKPIIREALRAFYGDGFRVAADVPKDWTLSSNIPLITVHDDGGPLNWPILSRNMIRVVVRGQGNPLVRQIAGRGAGYLHDNVPAGLEDIHRTGGTALQEGFDTDTGADMASFVVTATIRTAVTA